MNRSAIRAELVERAKKIKPIKPKFQFGYYKGKTLAYVLRANPGYIQWCRFNVARSYWPVGLEEAYQTTLSKRAIKPVYLPTTDYVDFDNDSDGMLDDFTTFHD